MRDAEGDGENDGDRSSASRPIVARAGVTTETIAARIDASEVVRAVANDYGISVEEVEEALLLEKAA